MDGCGAGFFDEHPAEVLEVRGCEVVVVPVCEEDVVDVEEADVGEACLCEEVRREVDEECVVEECAASGSEVPSSSGAYFLAGGACAEEARASVCGACSE